MSAGCSTTHSIRGICHRIHPDVRLLPVVGWRAGGSLEVPGEVGSRAGGALERVEVSFMWFDGFEKSPKIEEEILNTRVT